MGVKFIVPPNCLRGRTAAILASGPSLTNAQCAAIYDAGIFTVCVNDAYLLAPWCHALYSSDARWYQERWKHVASLNCLKVTQDANTIFHDVLVLNATGERGFDPDPSCIRHQNNSGGAALNALAHARPSRVILVGFDYHHRDGEHFNGEHSAPLRRTDASTFRRWIDNAAHVAPIYAELGIEVVNCSPGSDLKCFRKMPLEDALAPC